MALTKIYKRMARPVAPYGHWYSEYMAIGGYANSPKSFIKAFKLIQQDLKELCCYIEPADENLNTYSHRVYELLLRICAELETNFTAILTENGYVKSGDLNMADYRKVVVSHNLENYEIKIPDWFGGRNVRTPFQETVTYDGKTRFSWWDAYNKSKHDRHNEFRKATFDQLMGAITALVAVLASQFARNEFESEGTFWANSRAEDDDFLTAIGGYFEVKFPVVSDTDWYDYSGLSSCENYPY